MKKTLIALALAASMSAGAEVLHHSVPIAQFSLTDASGNTVANRNLVGKRTLLFFGFTSCPDICPATLSVLEVARSQLPDVQVLFVSVDPNDGPAQLAGYEKQFSLRAATGEVGPLLKSLGVNWDRKNLAEHPAAVFAIDSAGKWAAYWRYPQDVQQIVNEMARVK